MNLFKTLIAGITTLLMLLGLSSSAGASCGEGPVALIFVSGLGILGVGIYDIATAPASARRYNEQHWSVAPVLDARDHRYGLALAYTFGRSPSSPASFRQQEWHPIATSSSKAGPRPSTARTPAWLVGEARMPPASPSMADTSIQQTRSFKSPQTAVAVSAAFTLIPSAIGGLLAASGSGGDKNGTWGGVLLFTGAILGPSAGHWYAGQTARGWKTVGLRVGLVGVGLGGFIWDFASCGGD